MMNEVKTPSVTASEIDILMKGILQPLKCRIDSPGLIANYFLRTNWDPSLRSIISGLVKYFRSGTGNQRFPQGKH